MRKRVNEVVRAAALAVCVVALPAWSTEKDLRQQLALQLTQALEQAPEVQSALAELQSALADVDAATYAQYPSLDVGVSGNSGDTPSRYNPAETVDRRLSASVRWTMWDFGKTAARKRIADFARQAAEARVAQAREQFVRELLTAYLEVSRYELLTDVGRNSRNAMERLQQLEDRRVQLGGAGVTDARLAASRLAQSVNKALQFEQGLHEARLRLGALLGSPIISDALPAMQVPPGWLSLGGTPVEDAVERSATLRAQRLNLDQARANIEMEESGRFPAVDLTWVKRYEYPGAYSVKPSFGVQLSMGTSGVLDATVRIQRASSKLMAEAQKLMTMRREGLQKAQAGEQRIALSDQRVKMLSTAAGDAGMVVDARRKLNQAGRGTTLALLDAQVEANNTLIDWVQALYDQRVSEVEFATETGRMLPDKGQEPSWFMALFRGDDYRKDIFDRLEHHSLTDQGESIPKVALKNVPSFRIGLAAPGGEILASSANNVTFKTSFRMDLKLAEKPAGRRWW